MRSRGLAYSLGAGTRKSLVLFWTALLLCSVLLQYASLASPQAALAVHDDGVFELDGNAVDQPKDGDDWENGTPGADDSLFIPGSVEKAGPDASYFTGGGSKDENDLTSWNYSSNDIAPDKDELLDVFASVYQHSGDTLVYFGADKFDDSGDSQIGFWFFRRNVSLSSGNFVTNPSGGHAKGDVLILSDFTNGGSVDRICVYEWDPANGGTSAIKNSAACDLGDNLVLVASGADCQVNGDGAFDVCADVNDGTETAPWTFVNKDGATNFGAGQFYEGGINLSSLFGDQPPCFNTFLAETRSSQETDAQLKDFALGSLDTCVPPDLTTEASKHDADFGDAVTDTATLSGSHGPVEGKIKFFLCGPSDSYPVCDGNKGDQVGSAVPIANNSATSDPYTIGTGKNAAGKYCIRAEYVPAADSQYLPTQHTDQTKECFKVDAATIAITKTANPAGPVNAGDEIGFDITVSNTGTTTTLGVDMTDTLPSGIAWTADAPTGTTGNLQCAISNGQLECTKPGLAAGASFTVHVHGLTDAADCGKVTNKAHVGTSNDGSADSTADVTVQCPDLKVTKEPDPGDPGSSINAGETATFTIKVENVGAGDATGVTLDDDLPDGVDWAVDSKDCSIAPDSGTTGQVLSCDFGGLKAGNSVTVTVTGLTDKADCGTIPNTASASATNEPGGKLDNNADDAAIEVKCASIEITKVADDATVNSGDQIGFVIKVTNAGTGTAFDVQATDTLPAGFAWSIDSQDGGWAITNGVLGYTAASLKAGDHSAVHIVAPTTAEDCHEIPNTASVTAGNDGSGEASATTTVQCPDVHVQKDPVTTPISAGDTAAFKITVSNDGKGIARDVTFTDPLPSGIAWTDDSAACDIAAGTLSCDFGDLAAGDSVSVTVSGETDAADCGDIHNVATVGASNESAQDALDNTDNATVVVQCPDVHVIKDAVASPISAGDPAAFKITVSNDGKGIARDVTLTDDLPAGIAWSDDSDACTIASGTLSCDFGDLKPGDSVSVTVSGKTDAADCGTVHNLASVAASNESAQDALDNTDAADVVVQCPDVHVQKDPVTTPISAGDTAAFKITVSNDGKGIARDVTFTDPLPSGIAWTDDSAACDIAAGTLSCDFGDLAAGDSVSVTVSGETDAADCGDIHNVATVGASNESAQDALDNTDDATVHVDCPAILITKSADDPEVSASQGIGFRIVVSNNGAGLAKGVTVSDPLPTAAGLAWAIDPDAQASDPGWSIENGVLKYGPADLAPGAHVKVHITSPTTPATCGTVHNTATVATSNSGGDDDSSQVQVDCPDLRISKTAKDSPILAGQTASFTIKVWNEGPGTAFDVVVTDPLPAGIDWTDDSERCDVGQGVLTCELDKLGDGESFSVTISGPTDPASCADIPNEASVSASNEPTDKIGDNSAEAEIDVQCASIDLVKTAGDAPDGDTLHLSAPGDVVFTYVVTNTGSSTLVNLVLVDDNATPGDASDDVTVVCPKATLEPGESMLCTATMHVGVGERTNVAKVTANPEISPSDKVSDTDDAVVVVPKPKPSVEALTPPPTSTLDAAPAQTPGGSGLLLVVLSIAGIFLTVVAMTPATARASRRRRR